MTQKKVWFFDVLRCVAAIAVVAIHVLGPYRTQLGILSDFNWITAITINSFSRWAVPIFIMISGALLLSNPNPINAQYFITRRVSKVLIPFVAWSVLYALLSGATPTGFDFAITIDKLQHMLTVPTYYHLGFFYYFIPLYLLIPIFHYLVRHGEKGQVAGSIGVWLIFTALFLLKMDGPWSNQYVLYSGYLLLGYWLYRYPPNRIKWWIVAGVMGLLITDVMVISQSFMVEKYTVGRWLSYKTFNTVVIASMVFVGCRWLAENLRWSERSRTVVSFISRYSLGIYVLHPLFLWPVMQGDWYGAPPLLTIVFWTVVCGGLALLTSWLLSRSRFTAWLVP